MLIVICRVCINTVDDYVGRGVIRCVVCSCVGIVSCVGVAVVCTVDGSGIIVVLTASMVLLLLLVLLCCWCCC